LQTGFVSQVLLKSVSTPDFSKKKSFFLLKMQKALALPTTLPVEKQFNLP